LVAAVEYALLGGGKRLRPLIAWHSCIAVGGTGEDSLSAGAAVELIHAFSLVHDDLPAIDNDDVRRGRPSLHKHAGEAMAILAGDAMLTRALELLTEREAWPAALRLELITELARATSAMIAGQVYDTMGGLPDHMDARERTRMIHRGKTGALLTAAARMGAMCGLRHQGPGAADEKLAHITRFAGAVGLAFQIVDDLLDVTQSSEHAGKKTNKDAAAGKVTYPAVFGVEGSLAEVARLRQEALSGAAALGPSASNLTDLCEYLCVRTR